MSRRSQRGPFPSSKVGDKVDKIEKLSKGVLSRDTRMESDSNVLKTESYVAKMVDYDEKKDDISAVPADQPIVSEVAKDALDAPDSH